jgi:hypothetical protein
MASVPSHFSPCYLRTAQKHQRSGSHSVRIYKLNLNSGIETADSADFTDFEAVIEDERTNFFVAKLQGIDIRNLLYACNLRLNPFRFLG